MYPRVANKVYCSPRGTPRSVGWCRRPALGLGIHLPTMATTRLTNHLPLGTSTVPLPLPITVNLQDGAWRICHSCFVFTGGSLSGVLHGRRRFRASGGSG